MRINKLSIENFRNHKKTELNLDRINFFVGGNNAGKTSILAAIEWGLTGRCMWTDRAGRGAADLVRQGEKHAIVAMEVAGLGAVVRSLPPHPAGRQGKRRQRRAGRHPQRPGSRRRSPAGGFERRRLCEYEPGRAEGFPVQRLRAYLDS